MNDSPRNDDDLTFGDELLGLQGFSAARAARYRTEVSALLADRISPAERWWVATCGTMMGALMLIGAIAMAWMREPSAFAGYEEARWTLAAALGATGLSLGGWMARVGIRGGYGRRAGDVVGALVAVIWCGGSGIACLEVALSTADPSLRLKMLTGGAALLAVAAGCLLAATLGRMHRQTQERLLRIEYHVAELLERSPGRPG